MKKQPIKREMSFITQSTSALEVFLHPLVILNVSDHFTRMKANSKEENVKI
jgi:hypothetical protein